MLSLRPFQNGRRQSAGARMRCSLQRITRVFFTLACVTATHAAFADPALPWPGFLGEPAQRHVETNADGSAKHLYMFGSPYAWQSPIVWNYNDAGRPPQIDVDQVTDGIDAAARKWMDVCRVDIHRGANSTALPQNMDGDNSSPGENVIGWGDLTLGVDGDANVAGVTWLYSGIDSTLSEFDMTLSTAYVQSPGQLARVAVHELGHALGLSHSNLPGAVMSGPDNQSNPGVPDTQYNSQSTLSDDDTHGCLCLYGPSDAMAGQGYLCGLPTVAAMGTVPIGAASAPRSVTLTNQSATASLTVDAVTVGSPEMIKSAGCGNGTSLAPGQSCSFDLVFRPAGAPGARTTSYVGIATSNGVGTYGFPVTATAADAGTSPPPPTAPAPQLTPSTLDFGAVEIGAASALGTAILSNAGGGTLEITSITPTNADAALFLRSGSCVAGVSLAASQSCALQFRFAPTIAGARTATFEIATSAGTQQLTLTGAGVSDPVGAGTDTVAEYYNAALDHYFITASAHEMDVLDTGQLHGWVRTGYTFHTFVAAHAGTSPVCRYYIPPAQGDSHFYSVLPSECNAIPSLFPSFELEGANVMYMYVPDLHTGACPAGSIPVYRVWNQRPDSNHRYTIDRNLRDQMVTRGYVAEGYGPDAVGMCAPQ